jgi:hypothetical protein
MTRYLIVVYKEALSDHEVETISSLSGDIKIEYVYDRADAGILSLMETVFDTVIHGCYKLIAEDIPGAALLASKPPLYIGYIDHGFEKYYKPVMDLYIRSLDILHAIDELNRRSDEQITDFNDIFKRPSEIAVPPLGQLEDQVLDDMAFMKGDLNKRLEQQRLK